MTKARTAETVADKRARKFTCEAGALHAAMKDVSGAVEARSTIPILSHLLLECSGSSLRLTGTDLDLWVAREIAVEIAAEDSGFAICVPAAPLAKLVGEIEADSPLSISLDGERPQLLLKVGRCRFRFHTLPVDDFPQAPDFDAPHVLDLPVAALADPLGAVRHAVSSEETRYYLNGVYVHVHGDALRFAATDGARLARWTEPVPGGCAEWPAQIWPKRAVGLLEKLIAAAAKTGSADDPAQVLVECEGAAAGAKLRWTMPAADGGDVVLTAKSIDGTFPDYPRVIPVDPPMGVTVGKGALATALRRAGVLASKQSRAVKIETGEGKLTVRVIAPDLGEATIELPAICTGGEKVLGLDVDKALQVIAPIASDELRLRFGEQVDDPVLVLPASDSPDEPRLLQVLMPMRV